MYSGTQKLLWSVEGRSPVKSKATLKDAPSEESIELGAEASEELQLGEEVPSTAAAIANAIFVGLRK